MTAHAPTRHTSRPTADGAEARLPWWAAALPVIAFAVLLSLLAGAGEAEAADAESRRYLADLLGRLWGLLSR
ncbi:hypothetical protein [Streptomyces sp. CNQ085]|uniref:hypothetical protein n=1 Tax=Streptomyces sp. CNQ085 TaxID=2886944 RepID=UPI001F50843C|nr:hypothetical protein [Streptomyces sp. CNQ085]MCI0384638.1 hypothetical protein [Streptomyces sp. CNQ085]